MAAAARGCARRAALQHFWDKDEAGLAMMSSDSDSATLKSLSEDGVMLVGSLVHRAFQQVIFVSLFG